MCILKLLFSFLIFIFDFNCHFLDFLLVQFDLVEVIYNLLLFQMIKLLLLLTLLLLRFFSIVRNPAFELVLRVIQVYLVLEAAF